MAKYLLIELISSKELVVINCNDIDDKYQIVKMCVKSEQLCAFSEIGFKKGGERVMGRPLFISDFKIACEESRLKILKEREIHSSPTKDILQEAVERTSNINNDTSCIDFHNTAPYQASLSDSLEGNDYRLRIASTVTREPDKIAAEVDKQTLSSATNDPEITELHNVNTQANNTQSIHASNSSTEAKRDEGLESARKRVKFSADLNDSVRENLVDLWYEILSMKQQAKACSCKKNDEDEWVIVGGKYKVLKSVVSYGLISKERVDGYFKYLIRKSWDIDEYLNRNISGRNDKRRIDKEKLNAFICYAITSWNDYHAETQAMSEKIIDRKDQSIYVNKLTMAMSSLCSDTQKRKTKK